ncbi:hypothetical protein SAMN05421788_110201 [Filimonas lacunae]|uniref:DUF4062 domain-containing protein n=1 Tax=Filimonas lacunae TaxID=477680 RepID=A0A1N7R8Q0_9BACT|nr:hypothetical protein SAMN05421788_110201 [Filimonas lacunae]
MIKERDILLHRLSSTFYKNNHQEHCGFSIVADGWEDLASQPGYAQDVINEKLINECDFVIAVFKHKLGSATKNSDGSVRAPSGTAEELLQSLDIKKLDKPIGMTYFFHAAPVISLDAPDKQAKEEQWFKLQDFKKELQNRIMYKSYSDPQDLLRLVALDLEKSIKDYIIPRT